MVEKGDLVDRSSDSGRSGNMEHKEPIILEGLKDQTVIVENPFIFRVTVENADNVSWQLGNETIEPEPEEGLIIKQEGTSVILINLCFLDICLLGNEHMLIVEQSMDEDEGHFTVIARNSFGEKRSTAFLRVNPKT